MSCKSKKEKYECSGKTFDTKEEYEAHVKSHACAFNRDFTSIF